MEVSSREHAWHCGYAATSTGSLFRVTREPLPSAVRSWQKPLAGAVQRIRCHSHPRMLHHHSPDHDPLLSLLLLLIFSFPLRWTPPLAPRPSFSRMIPPFTAFSNHFLSFPICRTVFLRFLCFSLSRSRPPSSYNRTWCCHQSGAIHKPINSSNKLDRRATYSDPRPSREHAAGSF